MDAEYGPIRVARVDWEGEAWSGRVYGSIRYADSAVKVMLQCEEYCAQQGHGIRWEDDPGRPHAFHGFAAGATVAPATIIDPADDPTPDEWGTDPEPTPEPPNAEPARRADADHAFEELRKGDNVRRCTEPGCNRKHQARGLCDRHYARAKAAGALPPRGTAPRPSEQRPTVAPKDPNRIAYGAAMAPARAKPGITAESLGYAAGAPIRWPEDWTTTPDPELGRIAAAALARCSGDKREARKYLGAGQPAFDRALKIARDLGLA